MAHQGKPANEGPESTSTGSALARPADQSQLDERRSQRASVGSVATDLTGAGRPSVAAYVEPAGTGMAIHSSGGRRR